MLALEYITYFFHYQPRKHCQTDEARIKIKLLPCRQYKSAPCGALFPFSRGEVPEGKCLSLVPSGKLFPPEPLSWILFIHLHGQSHVLLSGHRCHQQLFQAVHRLVFLTNAFRSGHSVRLFSFFTPGLLLKIRHRKGPGSFALMAT